ncbi:MAG TPA: alpha-L-rhamnosidase, partial [Bacteroidales bacterium]
MIKETLFLIVLVLLSCFNNSCGQRVITVMNPRCEYEINPLGLETDHPRLSWELASDLKNQTQSAFRIIVADNPETLTSDKGNVWDTKKIKSNESIQVEYQGKQLEPNKKYYWKVKVWNQDSKESDWSETASWQMGLLSRADWGRAQWITMPELNIENYKGLKTADVQAKTRNLLPQFRKEFQSDKQVKYATAYISGLGQFEMSLNGQKVG